MTNSLNKVRTKLRQNQLILPIYLPTLLIAFGRGMLIPILPLYVRDFGVSYGLIGLVLAGEGLGMLIGDMPSSYFLRRLGRKRSMIAGLSVHIVATVALFWASSIPEALAYRLLSGFGISLFGLSRHLYMAEMVKLATRGRAIALFGGINRIGTFLGPAIGGTIAATWGLRLPFILFGAVTTISLIVIAVVIPRTYTAVPTHPHNIFNTIRTHYRLLAAAGAGQLFAQSIRAGRSIIIPLIGTDLLGLDVQEIGLIISATAAVDMSLFYPAGWLMDRFGRKFAIVPTFFIQAIGMALLPLSTNLITLLLISCLIGLGNGLSSGSMMTIGADLAPTNNRSEFLGAWRFIGDGGSTLGPILVGTVAELLVLQTAALTLAGCGILASLIFARYLPEPLTKKKQVSSSN
ncbi:MAG: MFS transporter [Chloroflexi bacterium]|nr:MFS transporter [Chloroflexota bacterium]